MDRGKGEASPPGLVLLVSVWCEGGQHFVHFPSANCQIQLLHSDPRVLAEQCTALFTPVSVTGLVPEFLCIPVLIAECSQEMALP